MKSLISGVANALTRTPIPYSANLFSIMSLGNPSSTRYLKAMGSVGTLFSIVNRTSTSTAKVEWHLYRKSVSGDPAKRVQVTRHLALDVWENPNPFMSGPEFREIVQQHIDLTGEMWWVVGRDPRAPSIPIGMWPVRPDRMEPIAHPTQFISHYEYVAPDGQRVRLELDQVIFIKMPNPDDPYRGMGPVQSVLTDIDAVKYSAEWNRNFFLNGAEPGGILKADRELSDRQFEKVQMRWDEQHRGVKNAHRVAILENMDWVERKFTNRDMQFVELRHVSRDVLREAFSMPKFAVGDVDDVNRATAEASSDWFGEHIICPRLERMKGALNKRFLPLFGPAAEGLEFDYVAPYNSNYEREVAERDSKTAAYKVLVVECGVDPAEASQWLGIPKFKIEVPKPAAPMLPADPGAAPLERVARELAMNVLEGMRVERMTLQGPPGPRGERGHPGMAGMPGRYAR